MVDQRNNSNAREKIVQNIPRIITDQKNKALWKQPTKKKVRNAIFIVEPDKAPGTYGFLDGFFQKKLGDNGKRCVVCCKRVLQKRKIPEIIE